MSSDESATRPDTCPPSASFTVTFLIGFANVVSAQLYGEGMNFALVCAIVLGIACLVGALNGAIAEFARLYASEFQLAPLGPLELLLLSHPYLLILDQHHPGHSRAEEILDHPALRVAGKLRSRFISSFDGVLPAPLRQLSA